MIGPIEKVYAGIHGKSICKKLPVLDFLATVLWPHPSMYEMFPYFVLLILDIVLRQALSTCQMHSNLFGLSFEHLTPAFIVLACIVRHEPFGMNISYFVFYMLKKVVQ